MPLYLRTLIASLSVLGIAASADAEVLVRWTHAQIPSLQTLGVTTIVIPAGNGAMLRDALAQGYRVYLEGDAAILGTRVPSRGLSGFIVRGRATPVQMAALRQRLGPLNARVLSVDARGKWPHIRSNWVTKNNDVLQVAGRSAQPWIETNAALIRIAHATRRDETVLSYDWAPITVSDTDEGPALENYLVAVAEAGSFGADLLLPLHERFQRRLLLGHPEARRDWAEVRRYIEFFSGDLPRQHETVAGIGVVTSTPMVWYEVMNLLARHNLPFELIDPSRLTSKAVSSLRLLVVLDDLDPAPATVVAEFEQQGGLVKAVKEVADPNRFALDVRRVLGREKRIVDVWNGITVITAPYKERGGSDVLLTLVNYAHQALPVQLRVAGTFARVHYESPEHPAALLPHQHRDGQTEVVVPALRIGGRVFFSH